MSNLKRWLRHGAFVREVSKLGPDDGIHPIDTLIIGLTMPRDSMENRLRAMAALNL